jgi:FdhD protein
MGRCGDGIVNLFRYPAFLVNKDKIMRIEDNVCIEDVFRLYLNDEFLASLVASPNQLKELGAGFVVCEGLAKHVNAVDVSKNKIKVYAKTTAEFGREMRSSGGGISVEKVPKKVNSSIMIKRKDVFKVMSAIESELWKKTGGVHCSVLFSSGELIIKSGDVGRHNTVDKVVGFAILNNIDLSTCVIGCTGRQPAGMVSKTANAGIPIVISKAPSTDKGILTADKAGITLICFARDNRFTIYTHFYRIYEIASGEII